MSACSALIAVGLRYGLITTTAVPSGDQRDRVLRGYWLAFLRQKAATNPEAAAAFELYRRSPALRLHLAPPEEMKAAFRGRRGWRNVRGAYVDEVRTVVLGELPERSFFDRWGNPHPWPRLEKELSSAAPVLIHETAHYRTAVELGFEPRGAVHDELAAFAHEKRYLEKELTLTPRLRRIARARLHGVLLGDERVLRAADEALAPEDGPERREARRIYDEWGLWSDALKSMTDEELFNAMLVAAAPPDLCRALSRPGWYGTRFEAAQSSAAASALSDPAKRAAARAYFRKTLPQYAGCPDPLLMK